MLSRVYVVADSPEAERVALWLRDDLDVDVRVGDGSDATLHELLDDPVNVVVLSAGLAHGDALAFAGALRGGGQGGDPSLVLVADEHGAVRNALDSLPFGADRFLRRPLSRSALVFAVRSCLNLGRAGIVDAHDAPAVTVAMGALADIAPGPPPAGVNISSGVALHTLSTRIDQATTEAIEAFLADAVDTVLNAAPEPAFSDEDLDSNPATTHAPAAPPMPAQRWRESTVVLTGGSSPPPAAPDAARTGTYVSALRQHMSAVEARLFGEPDREPPPPEDPTGEIDLDAIGVTTVSPIAEEDAAADEAPGTAAGAPPPPPVDLAHEDPASLLGRLAREGLTAQVVFARGEAQKTVWLEEGRPVFAASASAADRMGEMLVREGKISREQHQRAREGLVASGRRIGEILVEQGALKRRELYPAVRRHLEDLLYALFAWDSGSAQVVAGSGARDEKIRLAAPAAALICEGIRRKIDLERLRQLVGPPHTVLTPRKPLDLLAAVAEADLGPEERQLVAGLDGRRSLAELAADAGGAELATYQLAHLCAALGLLAPGGDGGTDVDRTTGVLAGTGDASIDRERVLSKYAQVLEGDYFELLGVRRDASGHEVRRAFEAARRDFAPESFAVEVQRELGAELAAIGEVLGEAQRILRDDDLRNSYREHLIDGD